ncbi:MAG TPA: RDD family protein [Streptosporangiaceae bacterium]|nr:RDD family protein [Streptosporangiaceae bacterium]
MSHPPQGGYPRRPGRYGQNSPYGPYGQQGQPPYGPSGYPHQGPPPHGPPPGPPPDRDAYGGRPYGGPYGHQSPHDAYAPYLRAGEEPYPPAADLPLARTFQRTKARLIDFLLVAVFGFGLIFPIMVAALGLDTSGTESGGDESSGWSTGAMFGLFFVAAVLPFLYEAIQLGMSGQTIGKRIVGLRVVRADPAGEQVTVGQAVWRAMINNIGYQIPVFLFLLLAVKVFQPALLLMFGAAAALVVFYLRAAWDQPLHQAVHDRYAGTVVIDERVDWEEE